MPTKQSLLCYCFIELLTSVPLTSFLFEVDDVFHTLHVVVCESVLTLLNMRPLITFVLHFLHNTNNETFVAGFLEFALKFFSFTRKDFHCVADMNLVLSAYLEWLTYAGTAHFEFKVLRLAVKSCLDGFAEFYAVVYPNPILMVYFHYNAVVCTDGKVRQKIVFTFQPFGHQTFYYFFFNHSENLWIYLLCLALATTGFFVKEKRNFSAPHTLASAKVNIIFQLFLIYFK